MAQIKSPHDYQAAVIKESFETWQAGVQNICLVAPTGAGKTIIKSFTVKYWLANNPGKFAVIFAHRDVLLSQISLAAASIGLPHKMICSRSTEREIGQTHIEELGESWLSDSARVIIASVPTWIKRDISAIVPHIGLWCMDEFHHTLRENMWGQALEPLSHCIGLGVTATPLRGDKKGLGRHTDGVADVIIKTPGMGELIAMGRLSPYRVYTIPSQLDLTGVNVTSSGDYNQRKLAKASDKPTITGDAIEHYKRLANGKQGIVFAASVEHAQHVADEFKAAGINAVALSSKTHTLERNRAVRKFRKGEITLLVNYDLFGEGFDVPAVEVVILLRKTLSYGLFKQMFGRCLRVIAGKQYGILIDHVGNVPYFLSEHLAGKHLHDDPEWTLDRPDNKRSSSGGTGVVTRVCPACRAVYSPVAVNVSIGHTCPYCGHTESQADRNNAQREILEQAGTLVEYDTSYLDEILSKRAKVDEPAESMRSRMTHAGANPVIVNSAVSRHTERQNQQERLRKLINEWCNDVARILGITDVTTIQAEFMHRFGVDIFKAQVLSASEAAELTSKIRDDIYEKIFCVL